MSVPQPMSPPKEVSRKSDAITNQMVEMFLSLERLEETCRAMCGHPPSDVLSTSAEEKQSVPPIGELVNQLPEALGSIIGRMENVNNNLRDIFM